jgi:quercetin dioxygenase-like cupin family protein
MEVEPRKPTVKGPADWFTGDVFIDVVARGHGESPVSIGLVHFTPGARTAWHAHSLGQTLYVTEGEGRVRRVASPPSRSGPVTSCSRRAASGTGTAPPPITS